MQFPQRAGGRTIRDIHSQPIGSEFDVQSLFEVDEAQRRACQPWTTRGRQR
jgi:hypothetical protein